MQTDLFRWKVLSGANILVLLMALGCGEESPEVSEMKSSEDTEQASTSETTAADTSAAGAAPGKRDKSLGGGKASKDSLLGASPDSAALSGTQRRRLGPALRRLVSGNRVSGDTTGPVPSEPHGAGLPHNVSPAGRKDGKEVYSVLIEGARAEMLREAGIPFTAETGSFVTARLTAEQIREVASIEAVERVRAPGQATSQ